MKQTKFRNLKEIHSDEPLKYLLRKIDINDGRVTMKDSLEIIDHYYKYVNSSYNVHLNYKHLPGDKKENEIMYYWSVLKHLIKDYSYETTKKTKISLKGRPKR